MRLAIFFATIGACKPALYAILRSGLSVTSPATKIFGYAGSASCNVSLTRMECVLGLYNAGERVLMISPWGVAPTATSFKLVKLCFGDYTTRSASKTFPDESRTGPFLPMELRSTFSPRTMSIPCSLRDAMALLRKDSGKRSDTGKRSAWTMVILVLGCAILISPDNSMKRLVTCFLGVRYQSQQALRR